MKVPPQKRKPLTPANVVSDLVKKLSDTPDGELTDALAAIDVWSWPRSDLGVWIPVLDKLDAVLENLINVYAIEDLQVKPFEDETKKTLLEILRFLRLLLENVTNRKVFSSYDRINALLLTTDLDVLISTLYLLLRPAQQYSSQPSVSHTLSISTPRLLSLARRWPHVREYGLSLLDVVIPSRAPQVETLPPEARDVDFTFYRTQDSNGTTSTGSDQDSSETSSPSTSAGTVHIHLDEKVLIGRQLTDLMLDLSKTHSLPSDEKYDLMCRIRTAQALFKEKDEEREKLVIARLLAIAIFGHTHSESQANTNLFIYEPDLILHIAELLQIDMGTRINVQTAAVSALDGLSRYRNRVQEVLTAVNAGVNHGVLMSILRKTVNDIANEDSEMPQFFVETLLSFVFYISSHASGGSMVVGAGLIPLVVQLIENKVPSRLPLVTKTMQLVDGILYSFTNAFQMFCNARGVEAVVERIANEVDLCISKFRADHQSGDPAVMHGSMPLVRVSALKHLLRSMHRMMQNSGTTEGLRGLIDTSILKSIQKIIKFRILFGPTVLPSAIHIMATFVHNEPTSLAVIQEAGLPETFYRAVEGGIEPVIEVIQSIPNALGALCLNEAGQAQLKSRPSIIPSIFSIFTSDRHTKVLLDKENAVLVGTAVDELIRHHPFLRRAVFDSLSATLTKIEDLGNIYVPPANIRQWYSLVSVPLIRNDGDIAMDDVQASEESMKINSDSDAENQPHDNYIVLFIDVIGRFLEGLFQHQSHCREFLSSAKGLERLGRLTRLPCLPFDYANRVTSDSMVQVIRTLIDSSTTECIRHLTDIVDESLSETKDLWMSASKESKLLSLVELNEENATAANELFRCLVTLHIRVTLLSDVMATAGFAHGRSALALMQAIMSNSSPRIVSDLGVLHRTMVWQNIVLKSGLASKGIDIASTPSSSPLDRSPQPSTQILPDADGETAQNGDSSENQDVMASGDGRSLPDGKREKEYNATALKHLTHGLPGSLSSFFAAMVKMYLARRSLDPPQRLPMLEASKIVAKMMLDHLTCQYEGDKSEVFAYYTVMLGLATALLVDERTSAGTIHTIQLVAFYRLEGFSAMQSICQRFHDTITTVSSVRTDERSEIERQELALAYGGVKVALRLLQRLVSSRCLLESGQTALAQNRDKKEDDPEYFEPHNYIVRLRMAALPLLKPLWDAPWLNTCPVSISRSVAQAVLEIVNGDNEDESKDSVSDFNAAAAVRRPPAQPDENRIRQLTDMGFPRSAAERALTRAHNNVNAATELLLAHPFPFPPDPEPSTSADTAADVPPQSEVTQSDDSTNVPQEENPPSDQIEGDKDPDPTKTSTDWRRELNEAREPLRATVCNRSLALIDEHVSLIFDLHGAFVKPSGEHQRDAVAKLVNDIKEFSPHAFDVQEQPLANRCRLLALVLGETPSSLKEESRNALMDNLLALLLSNPGGADHQYPALTGWLASHLLVTEALFVLSEEPRSVELPKDEESLTSEMLTVGAPMSDARNIVADFCIRLLAVPDLPSDEFLAVLRLFVLFTRDRDLCSLVVNRQGLDRILHRLQASPVPGSASYIATILRHIVEDTHIVTKIMEHSIRRFLSQPRSRVLDVSSYARHCSAMALRDPLIFIDVTKSICQLSSPFSTPLQINLKENEGSQSSDGSKIMPESAVNDLSQMQVDSSTSMTNDMLEKVIHFLIAELMRNSKHFSVSSQMLPTENQESSQSNSASQGDLSENSNAREQPSTSSPSEDTSYYPCFLMQCLTELLFSYDSCKVAFLSYPPKKKLHTPSKDSSNKLRTATLQFLLNDLISFGTINPHPNTSARARIAMCNWAMSVVVALCVDTTTQDSKDLSTELVSVRKIVLESVNRAIRDLPSSESTESRYGRLLALTDLCHRLLTVRFNNGSRKSQDETPTHIAKVMLDKSFVTTLTAALAEVDLKYPNVKGLVASILRPLEYLSKVAIKMSRTSKIRSGQDKGQSPTISSFESEEEEEEEEEDGMQEDREETPDLYRNSALGMYGGEMEESNYDHGDMDDDDDEDGDVQMEFDEETASENTTPSVDESDNEEMVAEAPGVVWQQDDDDDEEDDDDVDDAEDPEDDDDEQEDQEAVDGMAAENEEMIWQDIRVDTDNGDGTDDEEGDEIEDTAEPVQIIHAEDEETEGVASDEEDFQASGGFMQEAEHTPEGGGFSFGALTSALNNNGFLDGGGPPPRSLFAPHRNRSEDNMQIFGRGRTAPAPPPEALTHPLLLDNTNQTQPPPSQQTFGQVRASRQSRHIATDGSADLIQTIEDLIGGGGVHHLIQQVIRGGGQGDTIRVDVPAATFVNLAQGPGRGGVLSASVRLDRPQRAVQRHNRDLEPLLTLQRWAEEVKILHGDFVGERVNKLANHVAIALIPAAMELEKQAKLRAEEDEAKHKQEEEKKKAQEESEQRPDDKDAESSSIEPTSAALETSQELAAGGEPQTAPQEIRPSGDQPMEEIELRQEPDTSMSVDVSDPSVTEDVVANEGQPQGAEATTDDSAETPESGPSGSTSRVTVLIHGSEVDITDTGVDPTFLEALPDDMREEVLNQHVRDQRAARVERPADSQISSEFLDALPPELRAEIIQQEAVERSRQREHDAPPATGPAEIDPASFIASLDPTLRQTVLMEQDDVFIQTLPSHMIAEAGTYRENQHPRRMVAPRATSTPRSGQPSASTSRKHSSQQEAVQLLDKQGVTSLVRLLFFPQVSRKNLLLKVLVNLCENSKTRIELFNLLLNILQDGTADLAAVDKSFSQMSVRSSKPITPKTAGKQKSSEYPNGITIPGWNNEALPDLIAQRCLEALTYIVSANEVSSLFFLTEHDLPISLRRPGSKKGKGKEKQMSQTHHPIVLLLGLLDRQSLLKTPSIMESVVGLLATVTRPLSSLKDKNTQPPVPSAENNSSRAEGQTENPPESSSMDTSDSYAETPAAAEPHPVNETSAPPVAPPGEEQSFSSIPNKDDNNAENQDNILLVNPPRIPHPVLRLIVNILTVGECSSRTFQQSLALIQHLSYIPDARDVIALELRSRAQEFGQIIQSELDELAGALRKPQSELLISSAASKFSSSSAAQAKLLRVLKTIDYMFDSKSSGNADETVKEDIEMVQSIYDSFQFRPLWSRLGNCLAAIEERSDTENIAMVLLPLIEALMVVCKYVGTKGADNASRNLSSPRSPTTPQESTEDLFVSFTDSHRNILNLMVRNNPSLMSGSFSLLVNNPRVLDFDNKRNYFNQQLRRRPGSREHYGTLQLNVRRARVFEDSFQYLLRKTGKQIKYGKLSIRFYDEEGVDAGGVTREWFQILARQMFDPNNALFQPCPADRQTYQPNKDSGVNPEHLSFFKFVGRVIGKAIYDGRLLDAYFAKSVYRQILGKPVDYKDVEWVDPEYYNSLCWILENDPTALELTFSVEADEFGVQKIVPLKEGGDSIPVTPENKREFVQLSAQYRLVSSIKDQLSHLLTGFYEIVPKELIMIFNEQELELLISGTPDIDVDEWRAATEYNGYSSSDPNIVWWWRALKSFNRDERAKVLSFATGTSRVPLGGFTELQGVQGVQRFSIHKAFGEQDRLPQAHTCFNQIDLPQYSSYEMLRQQLLYAISEGGTGFGFA